jgi:hypothetical protein
MLACVFGAVLMIAWWISTILLVIFSCTPVAYNWDKSIPGGKCTLLVNNVAYGITASNLLTDLYVFVLPIPVLAGLNMGRGRKFGIIGTFVLGAL